MSRLRYLLITLLLVFALACSFGKEVTPPGPTAEATADSAGGEVAQSNPTMTPVPPQESGTGCSLNAAFVADVTIPDNTVMQPGASFTKVWRVRNSGTCDWEPGTQLVFVSGEPMTAIGAVPVPAVAAGSMTDIAVDMTAPTTPGTYKSTWQLQSPEGVRFGNKIYVQIVVPAPPTATPLPPTEAPPTDTPTPTNTPWAVLGTIPPIVTIAPPPSVDLATSSRGQVYSTGDVHPGISNSGDDSHNNGLQAFVTYDLSSIPSGATIVAAYLHWPSYDTLGDPFGSLGCLRVYPHNYGTLDAHDYTPPPVLGAIGRYCSTAEIDNAASTPLNDSVKNIIHDRAGSGVLQLRLQFNQRETDGDGVADVLRGEPHLLVFYEQP